VSSSLALPEGEGDAQVRVRMSEYQYLAVNLRRVRAERLLSQADLAVRLGPPFTQQYLSLLECGRWPSRPEHVAHLARALGVSKTELLRKVRRRVSVAI